jgi:hypothetical protein
MSSLFFVIVRRGGHGLVVVGLVRCSQPVRVEVLPVLS